jgi:phage repressor protein C with HTH and peptisase S24 domain
MICSVHTCDVAIMSYDLDSPHLRLEWARKRAGYVSASDLAKAVGVHATTYRAYENGQNGFAKLAAQFAKRLGVTAEWLLEGGEPPNTMAVVAPARSDPDELGLVAIQQIDLTYGMGAAFNDSPVEVEVLHFPRSWVETITYSPPALLTWARGRGDSMSPTIYDGDLIMIDRSQRKVNEQDAIWAFAVGDVGSIKRLRVKGDRFVIMSDNPTVQDDEEPQDFVNIVGRVVFVGARK